MKELISLFILNFVPIIMGMEQLLQPRVYGGQYAEENQFPYQISLQKYGEHICGGAILTQHFVLTAAHCVTDKNRHMESPSLYVVVAGTISLIHGRRSFKPYTFIIHERYECCDKDIALIVLKDYLEWDISIQPIPIYQKELKENNVVTISGWGLYKKYKKYRVVSKLLKFDRFNVSSKQYCKKALYRMYNNGILCLRHPKYRGICNGDSGGPATFAGQLVGIASFVFTPCAGEKPDGYVKVLHYLHWINEKIFYDLDSKNKRTEF